MVSPKHSPAPGERPPARRPQGRFAGGGTSDLQQLTCVLRSLFCLTACFVSKLIFRWDLQVDFPSKRRLLRTDRSQRHALLWGLGTPKFAHQP
jgi:hypothetical protein